ncbi:tripartite tricarboxylate transporter TctB family protein [Alkalilacustris brevis]|uniref:tripartite tricarboxylate transporter TctB family protein n=1 Tax=Alkalilacustris brevis TaxID=2026338 RepID=UPI000E0CCC7F|nr:tripartite tricarboxylate transporter TctB family protein [Alkalilacustris brevis]
MERDKAGAAPQFNFNTGIAIGSALFGLAIILLTPYQVAEPPAFFGRSSSGISPRMFPYIAGMLFIANGLIFALASLRLRENNMFRGLPGVAYFNVAFVLVVMIAYVALLRPVGYVASSMFVATTISLYYGSRNPVGIGIVGVGAPLFIYFLFTRMLSVSLPAFPWG